jgi:hypothetical protein
VLDTAEEIEERTKQIYDVINTLYLPKAA